MVDFQGKDNGNRKYVCPSDRQLALRAKLQTGWSAGRTQTSLKPEEQAAIIAVIRRNELLEISERLRVGKLVERVEKIKQRAAECGPRNCRLCGQLFGILGPLKIICDGCRKPVCSKCSIEINTHSKNNSPETSPIRTARNTLKLSSRDIWLCKICLETREMWKKSGAWFFKGLPKYEIPQKVNISKLYQREMKRNQTKTTKLGMQIEDSSDEDEDIEPDEKNTFKASNGNSSKDLFCEDATNLNSKKSSISPYSNQISSSDSSQNIQIPNNSDWDSLSINKQNNQTNRRGSLSSNLSLSETSSANSNYYIVQNYKEAPLGWLELSINYEKSSHSLEITIHRARDLPAMDSMGLADPFCKLNIITPEGKVRQSRWIKTKTVHKTINPEFNENATFLGIELEELEKSVLYVVLLDDDKYGHDFLGATKLMLSIFAKSGHCRMSVPLGDEDNITAEAMSSGPWPRGFIELSLCYNTKRRALMVELKKCINLVSMDNNGFSDPFIKLQLKPDSHRKKQKTSIKWRNLNPVFNEEFVFETRPNDLDKQYLIITVWDKDIGKSNDFLGSLILGSNSKGRRLKQWKDCVRLPDTYHTYTHCLSTYLPGNN